MNNAPWGASTSCELDEEGLAVGVDVGDEGAVQRKR